MIFIIIHHLKVLCAYTPHICVSYVFLCLDYQTVGHFRFLESNLSISQVSCVQSEINVVVLQEEHFKSVFYEVAVGLGCCFITLVTQITLYLLFEAQKVNF